MGIISTKPTFVAGTYIYASEINTEFSDVIDDLNDLDVRDGLSTKKALFNANTILKADADNTPVALSVATSRIVGRKAAGGIAAMTAAEVEAILTGVLLKNGSRTMTGDLDFAGYDLINPNPIRRSNDTSYLVLQGGLVTSYPARMELYGEDEPSDPGQIRCMVPNAAKSSWKTPLIIEGVSDIPKVKAVYGVKADIIDEYTNDTGVTIDGCLIKDGKVVNGAPNNAIYLTKTTNGDLTAERATELRVVTPGTGSDIQTQINDLPA